MKHYPFKLEVKWAEIVNNIKDTALIFEGGGMRASCTVGFVNNLLENKIYFDYVAGISIFMPETYYDDHRYVHGGVAGGIALDIAKKDGFKKYIVIHILDCYNEQG